MEGQPKINEEKIRVHFSHVHDNACSYCGIKDRVSLVKCLNCDKHFCNNKVNKHVQSDIITHLSKSGHTKITPNRNMWKKNKPVACFNCEKRNIYKLFHYKQKDEDYIFCSPCAEQERLHTYDLDPVIREKRLPNWLADFSSKETLQGAVELSHKQIAYIEKCWSNKKYPKVSDILNLGQKPEKKEMSKIKTEYIDTNEYKNEFLPILKIEEECDRKIKGAWFQEDISITWEITKKRIYAYLESPEDSYFNIRLSPGERLSVTGKNNRKIEGTVITAKEHEIQLLLDEKRPDNFGDKVKVEYIWTNITFQRMEDGLVEFAENGLQSQKLTDWILNPPDNTLHQEPEAKQNGFLNKYQIQAVEIALGRDPIVVIQGPPGTGKTVTLTAILLQLVRRLRNKSKILVCAPSNIAVDHIAKELMEKKINVSRVYSRSRELINEVDRNLDEISLHQKIFQSKDPKHKQLIKYIKLKNKGLWLRNKEEKEFKKLRLAAELEILGEVKIVCCTCVTAADLRLKELFKDGYDFEYVVIDEAAQALEPETLLPLLFNAKKVILAGDHKQLGPLVKSKQGLACNFGQSLFERLAPRIKPILLLQQYRMHPSIAEFPSNKFYANRLITENSMERVAHPKFAWPEMNYPNFFYHIEGKEEVPSLRESYFNRREAEGIRQLVLCLERAEVKPKNIAILTPYHGQKVYLQDMQEKGIITKGVEIESIDGFQGREKDYILISCVRSNEELGLGFLNDQRRLNVALTRAKYGLIVCGNATVLSRNEFWKELIIRYRDKNSLVSGDIGKWKKLSFLV